eukprot:gene19137-biopygen20504
MRICYKVEDPAKTCRHCTWTGRITQLHAWHCRGPHGHLPQRVTRQGGHGPRDGEHARGGGELPCPLMGETETDTDDNRVALTRDAKKRATRAARAARTARTDRKSRGPCGSCSPCGRKARAASSARNPLGQEVLGEKVE